MGDDFQALVLRFAPDGYVVDASTSCSEQAKSIAVRRSAADDNVIRFKLGEWSWPDGVKNCDCLFLCKKKNSPRFVLALVELKGRDTKSAFQQISSTTALLCKRSSFKTAGHAKAGECAGPGHDGQVVAFIVAPGGGKVGGMWQAEAAKLKPKRILMQPVCKPGVEITVDQLYKKAFGEVS